MSDLSNAPITRDSDIELVSLFCGAGGLDLGFEQAGFKTIWANDILREACETHATWSDATVIQGDIKNIDIDREIPSARVVVGGFPCQGFSLAGPRKVDDKRNSLYRFFVDVVDKKQPEVFVAENVKGILTLGNGSIIRAIINEFEDKGYRVTPHLLNASDYGVPQDRLRVILVGMKNGKKFVAPKKAAKKVSIKEALDGIEAPKATDICDSAYSSRYMSRNRKRAWDQVSYTIPAMAKQCPLHPSSPDMVKASPDRWEFGNGETRRFSWQEAAAIQTFPKDLSFAGDLNKKYLQIGNAVPVKLARAIGEEVMKQAFQ